MEETTPISATSKPRLWDTLKIVLYILGALLLFLFAIDLMVSSLQHLGKNVVETIIQATSNPFTALFIGLLITAMIQSSSTTTALVVALVASGSLDLRSAVPIIMGANVGTTITSTIVSLGFINKRKEFRRAVSAGTYHCFFNLLTVFILFPLEYYYGFLSSLSASIASYFFTSSSSVVVSNDTAHLWSVFDPIINFLVSNIPWGFLLIVLSFALLFGSILVFRKLISDLLKAKSPEVFSRFFFKSQLKSFFWGLVTTAAIRSSTITTSVVVPIVAKKIATLRQAAPFIMGANVGTTVTAFIAAIMNSNTAGAISIAIAHFLFNLMGVLLFFPVPVLQKLPIKLASGLGKLTLRYRLAGFVFILTTFFFIPFSLIYFNRDAISTYQLTYETKGENHGYYRITSRMNSRTHSGEWLRFNGREQQPHEQPALIFPVYVKNNSLFIGNDMYLFNKPGFCWDGEDSQGKYKACVEDVVNGMRLTALTFDSVYVYSLQYVNSTTPKRKIYISSTYQVILRHEILSPLDTVIQKDELVGFEKK